MKYSVIFLFFFSQIVVAAPFYNDAFYFKQWSFNSKSLKDKPGSSIEAAHRFTNGWRQREVIVAVIDSGVDYLHPDLKDNMWKNAGEIPDNGIDDDGNGYIDDIYGIDLIDNDSDPTDALDHGTHVAGIIAAKGNNNIGIAGVARSAKIMSIRAIPNTGDEEDQTIIKAFEYAAKMGAKIINCSFSKSNSGPEVSDVIDRLSRENDILFVTTAGNKHVNIDDDPTYPASFQNDYLMTVGSCSQMAAVSFFSSFGENTVDLFAPGSIIYSLKPGNLYQSMNGTSQAAPLVSGIAAEIYSLFPSKTMREVKDIIMETTVESTFLRGKSKTGGRIDLMDAINKALRN